MLISLLVARASCNDIDSRVFFSFSFLGVGVVKFPGFRGGVVNHGIFTHE